jgi:hypothetical protein
MSNFLLFLPFLCVLAFSCSDLLCTSEISETMQELRLLTRARELLQNQGDRSYLTLLPSSSPFLPPNLVPKSVIQSQNTLTAAQFIVLKPFPELLHASSVGILLAYSSGIVELREVTGGLLYRLEQPNPCLQLSATNSYDEIKFACATAKATLESFSLIIEKPVRPITVEETGVQTDRLFIAIYPDFEIALPGPATSLLLYIRGGIKYWAAGDSSGYLTLIDLSGKKHSSTSLSQGPITALDRFGPQLFVSTSSFSGIFNPSTQQLDPQCSASGHSLSFDALNVSTVVHIAGAEGVTTVDTRVVQNDQFACKGRL